MASKSRDAQGIAHVHFWPVSMNAFASGLGGAVEYQPLGSVRCDHWISAAAGASIAGVRWRADSVRQSGLLHHRRRIPARITENRRLPLCG